MPVGMIKEFLSPPPSPDRCIFAQTTLRARRAEVHEAAARSTTEKPAEDFAENPRH